MSPSMDVSRVLARLQATLSTLDQLRQQISLPPSVAGAGHGGQAPAPGQGGPMPGMGDGAQMTRVIEGLRQAFVAHQLHSLDRISKTILRPVAANAIWADQPSLKSTSISALPAPSDTFRRAFPDYHETVTNIIGNERYTTVESRGTGTHKGPLQVGGATIPATGKPITIHTATVITEDGGNAVRYEQYYDLAGLLQQLGMLPNVPMGHDEPVAGLHGAPVLPPLMHPAGGFLGGSPETWPIVAGKQPASGTNVSIGRSDTPGAITNVNNCKNIHAAFVEHTPGKFSALLSRN